MASALVAGFGSVVADVLMLADEVLLERKNHVAYQAIQVGGVVPTALIFLSRLGVTTQLSSVLGDDLFGNILIPLFKKERVELDKIIRSPKTETPLAFVVIHKQTGRRTSFYTTGDFPTVSAESFRDVPDPKATHLLVDGHNPNAALEIVKRARGNNATILLDLGNPKKDSEQLIRHAHVVIVPPAYWMVVWPQKQPRDIIGDLVAIGPELVVLTMEEKGCYVGQKNRIFHQPSFAVDAIDTNGAGDVFFGAFCFGLLRQWHVQKTAEFACAAAALSCTKIGKDQKIPRSEREVMDFINAHRPSL